MINPATFQFLSELKLNNDKEWFDANRHVYHELRKDFELFINVVIGEIGNFDKEAAQTTAKASIFRINRDIRFSKDKLPYKTNYGAFIAQGGRKSIHAGYYLHVEPGACFLSGGIYMPSAPVLKSIRTEIYDNTGTFRKIVNAPSFVKHFGKDLWGEQLKTAPKGFPKDFPDLNYLKYKHYSVVKNEPDQLTMKPGFINEVKTVFSAMAGFNAFMNHAINEME